MRPNPKDASSFQHREVVLKDGTHYHLVDQPPSTTGASPKGICVLLHGFPDLWYGWRYQIVALVLAGYRVIVPSQLGYYPSSQPDDLKRYGYGSLSDDLCAILTELGINEKVLLFGHDWGGHFAWRFAAYYPDRVQAIAVVSTPYAPPSQKRLPFLSDEALVAKYLPNFGYQLWWKTDEAAKILEDNLEAFLGPQFSQAPKPPHAGRTKPGRVPLTYPGAWRARMLDLDQRRKRGEATVALASATSDPECHYYLATFRNGGLKKPLNYYKTRPVCFEEEIARGIEQKFPSGIPSLFIAGTNDEALPLTMSDSSPRYFERGQYTREVVEGADHWLLQDARFRDNLSNRLVQWSDQHSRVSKL